MMILAVLAWSKFHWYQNWTGRRQWQPTLVLLPGKSHGWRSLVGCSPWVLEESDTTERLHSHFSLSCIGKGNGNPLQSSCLENPRDGGASWAAVYGVTQSRTRLKWLSSSSSRTGWLLDSFISTSTYISKWCLRIESQDCSADIHESTFPNSWGKNLTILQKSILDKNPEHLTNLLFSLWY